MPFLEQVYLYGLLKNKAGTISTGF